MSCKKGGRELDCPKDDRVDPCCGGMEEKVDDPDGGREVDVGKTTMGFSVEKVAGVENNSDIGLGEKVASSWLATSGLGSFITLAEYHDRLFDISALQ